MSETRLATECDCGWRYPAAVCVINLHEDASFEAMAAPLAIECPDCGRKVIVFPPGWRASPPDRFRGAVAEAACEAA